MSALFFGKVVDEKTNEPLVGVEITVNNNSYYSNMDGNFTINAKDINMDNTMELKYISYKDTTIMINK